MPRGGSKPRDVASRVWERCVRDPETECWEWTAPLQPAGYGQIKVLNRTMTAHRAVYELLIGPVPVDRVVDHLCRNRACVNPAHMEIVTERENVLRGVSPAARCAKQTHCKYGHPFSGDNLLVAKRQRVCKTCHKRHLADHKARKKAQ